MFLFIFFISYLQATSPDKRVVKVGIYNNPPKVFLNSSGAAVGIFPDILRYIAKEEGWELKWVFGTWEECIKRLQRGEIDLLPDVAVSEKRKKLFKFSEKTVFVNWGQIYTRPDLQLDSIMDLRGKTVAVMKGSIHTEGQSGVKKLTEKFDVNCRFIELDSYEKVFDYIRKGKADAGAVNRLFGSLNEERYKVRSSSIIFNPSSLRYAASKLSEDSAVILNRLDSYLTQMKKNPDSILYQSLKIYLQGKPESWKDYTPVMDIHLTKSEKKWLKEHPEIRIGIDKAFPPFEYITQKNQYTGASSDYVNLIMKKLGIKFVLREPELSWRKTIEKAEKHEIDVLPCVGVTTARKKHFLYSRPYLIFPRVIITRSEETVRDMDSLKGKKVGVQRKSSHHDYIINKTSVKPVLYDSFQNAMQELSNGKIDAVMGNMAVASYVMRKYGFTNLTIAIHVSGKTYPLAFAIRKDWPVLRNLINKALDSISEQEKEKISQKWFRINVQVQPLVESLQYKLTAAENKWLEKHRKIRLGLDPAYAPYSFIGSDGKYHGIVPEYLDLLQSRLDLEIEIISGLNWPQILKGAKDRTLDVITPTVKTPEREQFLNFSNAYLTTPLVIMTRTDNKKIQKAGNLPGKRVALVKGYSSTDRVLKDYPSIKEVYVKNPLEGLKQVSSGDADAYVGVLGVSIYLASRNGITNLKIVSNYSVGSVMKQGFAVRKDWPELVSILDKALREIPESRKTAIYSKWIPISTEAISDPEYFLFTQKEKNWLKAHPRINVAFDRNFAPMEFLDKNGNPAGIALDYLKLISQKTGINFDYVKPPSWKDTVELARNEKVDLLPCITKTKARAKYLSFTAPYLNIPVVIYTRRDVPYVGSLNELKNKKVAVVKAYAAEEWLSHDYPGILLVKVKNIEEGFQLLQQRKVDAFIINILSGSYYLGKLKAYDIKVAGKTPYTYKFAVAVRPDWPIFSQILQKTLASIPELQRNKIYRKWISITYEHGFNYALFWKIFIPILLFLALIFYWNQRLAREIRQRVKAQNELALLNTELDQRIQERTADLMNSNIALEQSEKRYRLLFNSGQDAILVFNLNPDNGNPYSITDCNQKVCELLEFKHQELCGKSMTEIISNNKNETFCNYIENFRNQGSELVGLEFIARSGTCIQVEMTTQYVELKDKPAAMAIARDVTKRLEMEKRQRHSQKMEALGSLAGGIAHDFNNIIAGIKGYAELTLMSNKANSYVKSYMSRIKDASVRAADLVKQILTFSRQIDNKRTPVEIKPIVNEALKLLRASIPKTIEIRENADENPGLVLAAPTQIHQIIMNLCTNAYHAMETKGGILSVNLYKLNSKRDKDYKNFILKAGRYVILEVTDTGCGICDAVLEHIFEPYFSTKDKDKGTGLGLSVVHGIIKNHDGYISVSSREGEGTTFTIFFPRIKNNLSDKDEVPANNEIQGGSETILLADDDAVCLEMASEMLSDLGYQIKKANNGLDALLIFEENPKAIDIVITDMSMPGLNGLQLTEKLLNLSPEKPVIMSTGFSELVNEEQAFAAGVKAFIMKPIVKREMAKIIRGILDSV